MKSDIKAPSCAVIFLLGVVVLQCMCAGEFFFVVYMLPMFANLPSLTSLTWGNVPGSLPLYRTASNRKLGEGMGTRLLLQWLLGLPLSSGCYGAQVCYCQDILDNRLTLTNSCQKFPVDCGVSVNKLTGAPSLISRPPCFDTDEYKCLGGLGTRLWYSWYTSVITVSCGHTCYPPLVHVVNSRW